MRPGYGELSQIQRNPEMNPRWLMDLGKTCIRLPAAWINSFHPDWEGQAIDARA